MGSIKDPISFFIIGTKLFLDEVFDIDQQSRGWMHVLEDSWKPNPFSDSYSFFIFNLQLFG